MTGKNESGDSHVTEGSEEARKGGHPESEVERQNQFYTADTVQVVFISFANRNSLNCVNT